MLLRQSLYRTEVRLLPVIAGYWVRLNTTPNYEELIRILCEKMLDPKSLRRVLSEGSDPSLASALHRLSDNDGQETAESFEEAFGPMRIAGIDKILREKYWKNPISVTEQLYYRGLIFRESRPLWKGPPRPSSSTAAMATPANTPSSA